MLGCRYAWLEGDERVSGRVRSDDGRGCREDFAELATPPRREPVRLQPPAPQQRRALWHRSWLIPRLRPCSRGGPWSRRRARRPRRRRDRSAAGRRRAPVAGDPDVGLEAGAAAGVAVGDLAAAGRVSAAPEPACFISASCSGPSSFPCIRETRKWAVSSAFETTAPFGADAGVSGSPVDQPAVGADVVAAGVVAADRPLRVIGGVLQPEGSKIRSR